MMPSTIMSLFTPSLTRACPTQRLLQGLYNVPVAKFNVNERPGLLIRLGRSSLLRGLAAIPAFRGWTKYNASASEGLAAMPD